MFTHPEIQYQSVETLPDRDGFAQLSTADFRRLEHLDPDSTGWVPYCEDETAGQLICATGVDARSVAGRGLHYAQLRSVTTKIAMLPTAIVPSAETLPLERVYVFSPGRCGSTLLCQLLRAAGVTAFAEPGFYLSYLQRARGESESKREQLRQTLSKLEYLLLKPFEQSTVAVIKPHPYCSSDLGLFLDELSNAQRPRTIALLRRIHPWSRSWAVFNQTKVEQDVAIYVRYLRQLDTLRETTDCLLVSYEDLIGSPAEVMSQIGRHLDLSVDLSALNASLGIDAHAGDRAWTGPTPSSDPLRDILLNTLWQLQRPDDLIERLDIRARTG